MNFCGGQGIRQGLVLGRDFPDQAVDDCGGCLSVQTGCVVEQDTVLQHGMNNGLHILKGAESAPVAQSSGFGGNRQAQGRPGAGPVFNASGGFRFSGMRSVDQPAYICLLYTSDAADD